jgi:hypothetical protein
LQKRAKGDSLANNAEAVTSAAEDYEKLAAYF